MDSEDTDCGRPQSPEDSPKPLKLGGREFRGISQSLSAAQDEYLIAHLRASGAVEALSDPAVADEKRCEEMLTRILLSGRTFHVLAGLLTESGKQWTRKEADRNAAAFAAITDGEEKRAMLTGVLAELVIDFFVYGTKSLGTSRSSSSPSDAGRPTKSADPAISATSLPSSETSPETTRAASTR